MSQTNDGEKAVMFVAGIMILVISCLCAKYCDFNPTVASVIIPQGSIEANSETYVDTIKLTDGSIADVQSAIINWIKVHPEWESPTFIPCSRAGGAGTYGNEGLVVVAHRKKQ